jgi:hypothetical protein
LAFASFVFASYVLLLLLIVSAVEEDFPPAGPVRLLAPRISVEVGFWQLLLKKTLPWDVVSLTAEVQVAVIEVAAAVVVADDDDDDDVAVESSSKTHRICGFENQKDVERF